MKTQMLNALKVIALTPGIRSFLKANDPKSLEQVEAAIAAAESATPGPWFSVEVEGDGLTGTWTLAEMLEANKDDDHLCAWMRCALPGEKYTCGGGAAPISIVERFI